MGDARRAAALDLLDRLESLPQLGEVLAVCSDDEYAAEVERRGHRVRPPATSPFHFGRELAGILESKGWDSFGYFGGASAPLAGINVLREVVDTWQRADEPGSVVNNLHSTDWGFLRGRESVLSLADRLPNDNALGWVLSREAGTRVQSLPPSAATVADLDTPADVLLLHGHPGLGPHLDRFGGRIPPALVDRRERIRRLMRTPASTLTLIGRVSLQACLSLERSAQIWVRVFSEERGMVASGRLAAGTTRSLIGELVESWGSRTFLEHLSEFSGGVIWDCRVWLARQGWPSAADRYSADLGWTDRLAPGPLREAAESAASAPSPVLIGGQGVVGGSLLALVESTFPEKHTPGVWKTPGV
jgi:hypothetical protein